MFGTTVGTSPLTSSNYVGDRLFFRGLSMGTYVPTASITETNLLSTADLISGVFNDFVSISQNHVITLNQLTIDTFALDDAVLSQFHLLIPNSQKLNTILNNGVISQNHILESSALSYIASLPNSDISQIHSIGINDVNILVYKDDGYINQKHILSGTPTNLNTIVGDDVIFGQNHKLISFDTVTESVISDTLISQIHNIEFVNVGSAIFVEDSDIKQNHLITPNSVHNKYYPNDAVISQDHKISSRNLAASSFIDVGEVSQNHILFTIDNDYEYVLGTPFVNPSVRRVVNSTDISINISILDITNSNSVVLVDNVDSNSV